MSLLDLPKKTSGRKITKNFLKKHRFYVDRWGGPHDREKDTSVFYEALYNDEIGIFPRFTKNRIVIATIKYFPEEFDGYTTIGNNCNDWGRGNVAGKLVITYENDLSFEYNEKIGWTDTLVFDCKTHSDFSDAIDFFNLDLIKKGYEPIRY
jgi:hypothetical protein